jgi:hypothetical protein
MHYVQRIQNKVYGYEIVSSYTTLKLSLINIGEMVQMLSVQGTSTQIRSSTLRQYEPESRIKLRKLAKNGGDLCRRQLRRYSQLESRMLEYAVACICMYIIGEGLIRPLHCDHPWSTVLCGCIISLFIYSTDTSTILHNLGEHTYDTSTILHNLGVHIYMYIRLGYAVV